MWNTNPMCSETCISCEVFYSNDLTTEVQSNFTLMRSLDQSVPGIYMGVHDAPSCTFTQYIFHRYSKIMSLSKHVSTASHTLPLLLSLVSDSHVSKYRDEEQH